MGATQTKASSAKRTDRDVLESQQFNMATNQMMISDQQKSQRNRKSKSTRQSAHRDTTWGAKMQHDRHLSDSGGDNEVPIGEAAGFAQPSHRRHRSQSEDSALYERMSSMAIDSPGSSASSNASLASSMVMPGNAPVFTINRQQPLGSGGFGVVYKGFDNSNGVHVAVKEAHLHGSNHTEMANEFDLLKQLDHPHIVKVVEFRIERNVAQIFMEWMSSGSVHSILESNGFRLHELAVRRYALESLKGLEYLHSKDMLHRDIKPANMLVAGNGAVKLSDFGTSRVQESTSTTQHVVGTCAYMAPETIRGKYSEGSDVWAWACSVVEMASGVMPWSELPRELRGNIQLMFHIGSAQPPNHHPSLPEHLSPALTDLLAKCFSFDATARPSAKELLASEYFKSTANSPHGMEELEDYQRLSEQQPSVSNALSSSSGGATFGYTTRRTSSLQAYSTIPTSNGGDEWMYEVK